MYFWGSDLDLSTSSFSSRFLGFFTNFLPSLSIKLKLEDPRFDDLFFFTLVLRSTRLSMS